MLYVKSVLWLNLAPVVQKVGSAIHSINLYICMSLDRNSSIALIQRLNNRGQDYNIILNLVWFRISLLSLPVLIIQMYSVQVTMKFWFTLRTDFTCNIFKYVGLPVFWLKKYNAKLLRFRRRKTRLDQSQWLVVANYKKSPIH